MKKKSKSRKRNCTFRAYPETLQYFRENEGITTGQQLFEFLVHMYRIIYIEKMADNTLDYATMKRVSLYKTESLPIRMKIAKTIQIKSVADSYKKYKKIQSDYLGTASPEYISSLKEALGINPDFFKYKEAIEMAATPAELKYVYEQIDNDENISEEIKNILRSRDLFD